MPTALLIFYRLLGAALLLLAAAALWEKYRIVRGATLLPGRILSCRKAGRTSPRAGAGCYRYLVEVHVNGERLELETNDSFWTDHSSRVGKSVLVWYNPRHSAVVERKSPETELISAGIAAVGVALLLLG